MQKNNAIVLKYFFFQLSDLFKNNEENQSSLVFTIHPGTFGTLVLPRSKIPLSPPVHYWVSKIMTNNFYLLAKAQKPPPRTAWPPQSIDFFSTAEEMAASLSILPP